MVGWFGWGVVALLIPFTLRAGFDPVLAPRLTAYDFQRVQEILDGDRRIIDLEAAEMQYAQIIQPQIFNDLVQVYDPANAPYLKITYGGFTPEGEKRGKDLGFGLHVIKRLSLPLANGIVKIIDVNEHWAENKVDHGLFLPDEIRIKTLVSDGARQVRGSEKLYLFDLLRISWDSDDLPQVIRRTKYSYEHGENKFKQMRVPVSAPFSCMSCHTSQYKASDKFTVGFQEPGIPINHEQIVQDVHFNRPLEKSKGFVEYISHLESLNLNPKFNERAKKALINPHVATAIPNLLAEWRSLARPSYHHNWMGGDSMVTSSQLGSFIHRQGVYSSSRGFFVDAIEEIPEGKYRWWFPASVIP